MPKRSEPVDTNYTSRAFTPDKQQRWLDLVASGVRPIRAAQAVSVAMPTIYRFRANSPQFAELWQEAEEKAAAPIEDAMYEKALSGDFPAQKYWLQNRMPKRWKDQRQVSIEQEVSVTIDGGPAIERVMELQQILAKRNQNIIDLEGIEVDARSKELAALLPAQEPDDIEDTVDLDDALLDD